MKVPSIVFQSPTHGFSIDGWKSHFWFTKRHNAEKRDAVKERIQEATSSQLSSFILPTFMIPSSIQKAQCV